MGDRIEVPLDPADLEVVASDVVRGILEVTVQESFPRACHHCGPIDVVGHGVNSRTTRFKSRAKADAGGRCHRGECGTPRTRVPRAEAPG